MSSHPRSRNFVPLVGRPASRRPFCFYSFLTQRTYRKQRKRLDSWGSFSASSALVFSHHFAALHHKPHVLEGRHVLRWVAIHRNDVGPLARLDAAHLV